MHQHSAFQKRMDIAPCSHLGASSSTTRPHWVRYSADLSGLSLLRPLESKIKKTSARKPGEVNFIGALLARMVKVQSVSHSHSTSKVNCNLPPHSFEALGLPEGKLKIRLICIKTRNGAAWCSTVLVQALWKKSCCPNSNTNLNKIQTVAVDFSILHASPFVLVLSLSSLESSASTEQKVLKAPMEQNQQTSWRQSHACTV